VAPSHSPEATSPAAGSNPLTTAPTTAAGSGSDAAVGSPAGSGHSTLGLDRPVGSFAAVKGISGVTTGSGVVTGFNLTLTVADGHAEPLATALSQLGAYLPTGTSYGASTTSGPCRTLQILGSQRPATAAVCSDTSAGQGSASYSPSSIVEITVADQEGLS
jgi:hypothetical protein